MTCKPVACAVLLLAASLTAQPPAEPRFDVVSIRAVLPNAPMFYRPANFTAILPGAQYVDPRAGLRSMIAFAYDVKDPYITLVGLPNWAREESFSVAARPEPGFPALPPEENREAVRAMLRAMLADRFRLELHTETRQARIAKLELASGGPKVKEVDPPEPPAKGNPVGAAWSNNGGRIIGKPSTMASLAGALTVMLHVPVVDETGLTGFYDLDASWKSPDVADVSELGADGVALLVSALRSHFGLTLRNTTGPVKHWIVDHVERPSEN